MEPRNPRNHRGLLQAAYVVRGASSTSASSVRERRPSLWYAWERCVSTVRTEMKSVSAISRFVRPEAARRATRSWCA